MKKKARKYHKIVGLNGDDKDDEVTVCWWHNRDRKVAPTVVEFARGRRKGNSAI